MSKTTKRTIGTGARAGKETKEGFSVDKIIPEKYQTPVSLAVLLILFLIFFSPMYFGGKTLQSGDIITSKSLSTYVATHDNGFTLWNPYIFCGMPAYAMGVGFKWFNLIYVGLTSVRWVFTKIFSVEYAVWSLYLILLAITSFFLMKFKTKNTLISLFTAIAASFSTGLVVFLYIGHVTKLTSLCMYPLVLLMLLRFQKKIRLLDFAILTIALQLLVQSWHVQIIFYTLFAVGIYFAYYIIRSLLKKDSLLTRQLLKSLGVFAAAAFIAILIQSDNLTQIYEYSPYSTRGGKSVVETQGAAAKGAEATSGQAYYNYHTMWSFSPGEVMTFLIPSYYGFGNSTYEGPLTNGQEYRVNTYFGQMEMVDVAMYMGVLVFLLGLFAVFTCWKDPFVQFLTILSGLALLISFGKTFSPVFDLMFYYFPYFDKFRVPSMILVLVQLSFPFLAGIGLHKIISLRTEKDLKAEKIIKFAAYGFTALLVLSFVLSGVLRDWFTARLTESGKNPQYLKQLADYASDMFLSDTHIALALAALTFGLGLTYINQKISRDLLLLAVVVFTIFDLFRIDSRGGEYIQEANMDEAFTQPFYISAIKAQNDQEPFRILNLKQDGSLGSVGNDANFNAYFLVQDLYGYSGIKPRYYQDIMDVVGTPANPTLWRMLNTKYIVFDRPVNFTDLTEVSKDEKTAVYRYDRALPRAYFVSNVEVKPALQILNLVKNNAFDPKQLAFLEEGSVKVDRPDTTQAYVKISQYKDETILIQARATGNNFMFLGDTYFPKGWKATIDGQETKIYRVNHAFRGIIVPKGEHRIEFRYAPVSFTISKYVALTLSALVILILIISLFYSKNRKQELQP
ncbi:MAG TPA: YfhO family protein [Ignavibacteriales bacterium]|nr:YfhO family protein [Ignavibacteriales bacterium]